MEDGEDKGNEEAELEWLDDTVDAEHSEIERLLLLC